MDKSDADSGASLSDAELDMHNPLIPAFNALRKDAERYRWLRNYRPGLILDMLSDHEIPNEQWAADLDQAIDSRMTPNNQGEPGGTL